MRMPAFWFGIAMIAYDAAGHLACFIARNTGATGAGLWNTYSRFIWPSLVDSKWFDAYWASWFTIAIILIILGHLSTKHAVFSLDSPQIVIRSETAASSSTPDL